MRSASGPAPLTGPAVDMWYVPDERRGGGAAKVPPLSKSTAGMPALRRRPDWVAVAALVCGLCALGPVAMLLGVWGRHRVHSHSARSGYALASVGLWLGLVATLVYLWLLVDTGGASTGSI